MHAFTPAPDGLRSGPTRDPLSRPARSARRFPPGRRAFTVVELLLVVLLMTLAAGLALPLAAAALDGWAARSARDQALALLHRARATARIHGGARLALTADPAAVTLWVGDSLAARWPADGASGVRIRLPGDAATDELRFDALGLGIVASRTLRFQRGGAEARLIISSRGRGRRP